MSANTKTYNRMTFYCSIPDKNILTQEAKRRGLSRSTLLRIALADYCDRHKAISLSDL